MRQSFTHHELSKIIQMGTEGWKLDTIFSENGYNHVKMTHKDEITLFEQTEQGMIVYEKVGRVT